MKELEGLLQELRDEGHVDSEGVFTSSSEGALDRLSQRLLPDPQMYLLKCIQAMIAGHGDPIVVRQKIAWIEVEAVVGLEPPALDPHDWVSQAWRSQVPAVRHLATALVGGWRLFDEIHVDWGELQWKLVPGQGTRPEPLARRCPAGHARIEFKRKQWKLFSDTPPYFDRVFACPVPIRSPWVSGMWQVRSYSGIRHFPRPGCELVGCLAVTTPADQNAHLMVPDKVRGYPVFFEPAPPAQPLLTTAQKNDGMAASWYHADRFYLLTDQDDPSSILPIDAGVALDPIPVDLGLRGLYCVVSVQREGLQTDLSQFRLLQNEAFEALVAELRASAPELLGRVLERVQGWKPGAGFENTSGATLGGFFAGGVLGFGLIAATGIPVFHMLALPGALVGSYLGGRYWRRRAVRRLRQRAEALREPPP